MSHPFSLTMDAADPFQLGAFWCLALGYRREDPPAPYATWEEQLTAWGLPPERWNDANAIIDPTGRGPRIFIQKVPESKTAKNRVHLDVIVSPPKDRAAMAKKVAELIAAGATAGETVDSDELGYWIVMADPEGNEFCII